MPQEDLSLAHKKVLVRVDMNVPLKNGLVRDDFRLRAILPTLKSLLDQKARVILLSHLGRPNGPTPDFSLMPVVNALKQLLPHTPIHFSIDTIGPEAQKSAASLKDGEVLILENIRFHSEELQNDARFAAQLATLGDTYINDAFGTAHRAHASVDAITHHLPSAAGPLLSYELDTLSRFLHDPKRPLFAIIGGAKVASKLGLLSALIPKVEKIAIVGGMANTFLGALGKILAPHAPKTLYIRLRMIFTLFIKKKSYSP